MRGGGFSRLETRWLFSEGYIYCTSHNLPAVHIHTASILILNVYSVFRLKHKNVGYTDINGHTFTEKHDVHLRKVYVLPRRFCVNRRNI